MSSAPSFLASVPAHVCIPMGEGLELRLETQLSDRARAIAKQELRESEETAPAAIAETRRLLLEEDGLRIPLEDGFLIAALRACHWYPESTVDRLKRYFRFKMKNHKVSQNLFPSNMVHVIKSNIMVILPKRDQHGRRILLCQTGKRWDIRKVSMDDLLRAAMMWIEIALIEPDTQVAGASMLWDMDGLSLSQVMRFTPSFAKMLLNFLQECIPLRLKAIHFVKQSNVFDIGYNVLKPFLQDKLRSRIYFHGHDAESLAQHFDMSMIPTDYGGTMPMNLPSIDDLLKEIPLFENFFQELATYGYNKNKK